MQFARYVVVGVVSNLVLYSLYLLLTFLGMNFKLAMSLLYGVGVLQTFVFNKRWSFGHDGAHGSALRRYLIAYGAGYVLNLVMLSVLVDSAGIPHQLAQAGIFVLVAILLFFAQRMWVFEKAKQS